MFSSLIIFDATIWLYFLL